MSTPVTALRVTSAALLLGVALSACSGGGEDTPAASPPASPLPTGDAPVELDPAQLSAEVDNPYFPLAPGTRWVYEEADEDGAVDQVMVTATSVTTEIANGVTARVVRDTVSKDGKVLEDTFDWYAQDRQGTVWYLGERTAEFDNGRVATREGSFEAGVDGAQAGVIMPAAPADGMAYRQEYYKGQAEDNGEVLATQEMADVPAGHYDDLVLTKDTAAIEPHALEYKLFAAGVGNVLTLGVSGDVGRESLVRMVEVSDAQARAAGIVPLGEPYA